MWGSASPAIGRPLFYALIVLFEWALFAFAFYGSDRTERHYAKDILRNRSKLLMDIFIAAAIAVSWALVAPLLIRVLGDSGWGSAQGILPGGALEIGIWVVLSVSAGVCEEFVFRGYLQRQLSLRSRRPVVGLLGQALLFGASHGYQGWKNMALISILGCIYGVIMLWRKQLRPNVVAHACMDIAGAFGI